MRGPCVDLPGDPSSSAFNRYAPPGAPYSGYFAQGPSDPPALARSTLSVPLPQLLPPLPLMGLPPGTSAMLGSPRLRQQALRGTKHG